ncbi:TNF receptor-associated factor family protein DDB_G0272098-like isoform X2 [Nilaparvata lugens]|uniref:TNF receptor-associated factor family protein DDB_G0272098-like isoform X2 n=1 Tax=Nilaparvata lugens TaxID=108931 RepID=UPI00193D9932|nr:TNF receptor-associated factor family protein DDB_G0272098-like isoform X2 [Nilaparvata lugens]
MNNLFSEVLEESIPAHSNIQNESTSCPSRHKSASSDNSTPGTSSTQGSPVLNHVVYSRIRNVSTSTTLLNAIPETIRNVKLDVNPRAEQITGEEPSRRTVAITKLNTELLNKIATGRNNSQTNMSAQTASSILKSCSNFPRGNQGNVIVLDISKEQANRMSIKEILKATGLLGESTITKIGSDGAASAVEGDTKMTQLSSATTVMLACPSAKENKSKDNIISVVKPSAADSRLNCSTYTHINSLDNASTSWTESRSEVQQNCETIEVDRVGLPPVDGDLHDNDDDDDDVISDVSESASETESVPERELLSYSPVEAMESYQQVEINSEIICDNSVNSENVISIEDASSLESVEDVSSLERVTCVEEEEVLEEQVLEELVPVHDNTIETEKTIPYENANSNDTIAVNINFEENSSLDFNNSSSSDERKHNENDDVNVKLCKIGNDSIPTQETNENTIMCNSLDSRQNNYCDISDLNCSVDNESSGNILISMECDNLAESITYISDQQETGVVCDPGLP